MEDIENIKKEMSAIVDKYSKTLKRKKYISDENYIRLNKKLKELEKREEVVVELNEKEYKKDTSNFDCLSDEIKKMLKEANYDLEKDKDNILNFYHKTNQSELSDKVMAERIKEFKLKL